ncbi:MAG TPA: ABC transporter permease [Flavobacteriales bacterium]|nr:ABC transporter permease [Flavobacteriales bacterium]HRE98633.1 ABC transporter permease [Flavobacteriales bacterium]
MMGYILKRLLLFIPTLFVISLLAFIISVKAPGDPVEILSGSASVQGGSTQHGVSKSQKDSIRLRLGLDKPLFYFSMTSSIECDTLYKIQDKKHREVVQRLTYRCGDWQLVSNWYRELKDSYEWWSALEEADFKAEKDSIALEVQNAIDWKNTGNAIFLTMLNSYEPKVIYAQLDSLQLLAGKVPGNLLKTRLDNLDRFWDEMYYSSPGFSFWIPSFHWYGSDNQYHRWLSRLLIHGDFGYSYVDKEPISEKIWKKFFISFKLIFLSVLIAYLLSIPLGVHAASKRGKLSERISSLFVFMLYSLPNFFVGMILLYLFANPDFVVWFPESGYMDPNNYDPNWNFLQRWSAELPYMILPLITYTYSSFAFISRILRAGMLDTLQQDYVRTARAKGIQEHNVLWKHALRNSLLPLITMFVNIFPMAIGGSVIIETIFTYPGMGLASYEAIHNYDYPGIVAIFTLSGFLTMSGYLVADILYAFADPRITYNRK